MKTQKLILDQIDRKILQLKKIEDLSIPSSGWIYAIRQALGMSLRQLGNKMGITPQSVKEIEERKRTVPSL
jgi:DNA-binding transcriptional regulator YiaG